MIINIAGLIAVRGNLVYGIDLIRLWFVYRKVIKLCLAKASEMEATRDGLDAPLKKYLGK